MPRHVPGVLSAIDARELIHQPIDDLFVFQAALFVGQIDRVDGSLMGLGDAVDLTGDLVKDGRDGETDTRQYT